MGPFTEKDDEEACGKAGPLREAPYEKGRSLREGPWENPYGDGPLTGRDGPYGNGRSLRENPYRDGSLHREGRRRGLREGWALTRSFYGRDGPYGKEGSLTAEKDDEEAYGKAGPLRDGRQGPVLTGGPLRGPLRERLPKAPLRDGSPLRGPLREGAFTGELFTGSRGTLTGCFASLITRGTQNPKS